jgi:glucose/arabinose dehydrogenase
MRRILLLLFALPLMACDDSGPISPPIDGGFDAPPYTGKFCDLPGSFRTTNGGVVDQLPGGPDLPNLRFMKLPDGFCVHFFGNVGNPRQLRFSPAGELFVASPTKGTTSGGANGRAAIVVMPDDNQDGMADATLTFLPQLPSTQGMLFAKDNFFYYQDDTRIKRVPYTTGDRKATATGELVVDIDFYYSTIHWPKVMDQADDGTIYVTNGGDQGEFCDAEVAEAARPLNGGILRINPDKTTTPIAKGCRNPIGIRCPRGHNKCFAIELARDYTDGMGGREKLIPVREGDDWGFPCCATKGLPYPDLNPVPTCSKVAAEHDAFTIGSTPFDLDFEPGGWPGMWQGRVFVPLHGAAGTWLGARVVAIATNPATGDPLFGSYLDGEFKGAMADFATGFEDHLHGRPTEVAFSPDGRLFLSNDVTGDIVWIAPITP